MISWRRHITSMSGLRFFIKFESTPLEVRVPLVLQYSRQNNLNIIYGLGHIALSILDYESLNKRSFIQRKTSLEKRWWMKIEQAGCNTASRVWRIVRSYPLTWNWYKGHHPFKWLKSLDISISNCSWSSSYQARGDRPTSSTTTPIHKRTQMSWQTIYASWIV